MFLRKDWFHGAYVLVSGVSTDLQAFLHAMVFTKPCLVQPANVGFEWLKHDFAAINRTKRGTSPRFFV